MNITQIQTSNVLNMLAAGVTGQKAEEALEFKKLLDSAMFDAVVDLMDTITKFHDVVVIHDNDPDGYAAATILMACLQSLPHGSVVQLPVGHGKPFHELDLADTISNYDFAFILDHACDRAVQEKLIKVKSTEVVIIDHHPETTTDVLPYVVADTSWSTTMLTMGIAVQYPQLHLLHSPMPLLVNHYDVWKFGRDAVYDEMTKSFMASIFYDGVKNTDWNSLICPVAATDSVTKRIIRGGDIREYQNATIQKLIKSNMVRMTMVSPVTGETLLFGTIFHSDLIDTLANEALESDRTLDFILIIYSKGGNHPYKLSFRSSNTRVDVGQIARSLGGGGHRNASGVNVDSASLINFLSSTKVISNGY